jgi:hypothetical protein
MLFERILYEFKKIMISVSNACLLQLRMQSLSLDGERYQEAQVPHTPYHHQQTPWLEL